MKKAKLIVLAIIAGPSLSACSTVIEGTSQQIAINSSPAGASCLVSRNGTLLAQDVTTPFAIDVDKTKDDISVTCMKDGYAPGKTAVTSDIAAATFGNMIVGGLVGWGVDSIDGADNKYSSSVDVPLVLQPAAPTPPLLSACNPPDAALTNFARKEGYQYHAPCS